MNELTPERRKQLKIIVLLVAISFFVVYATMMYLKYTDNKPKETTSEVRQEVIFDQPKLQFFQISQQLNAYPDRIAIHYPYLFVIHPDKLQSEIYNMETKQKEKEVNEVLLDYYKGDLVYNKQGYLTYFNKINLEILCDQAFIKGNTEILCITRPDQNKQANKLISINPQTLEQKDLYESQNVLTAVYFDKSRLYLSKYDFVTNKSYIRTNNKTAEVPDLINMFYPMRDKFYAASFKSLRNKQTESYYEVSPEIKLIDKGKIVFFK